MAYKETLTQVWTLTHFVGPNKDGVFDADIQPGKKTKRPSKQVNRTQTVCVVDSEFIIQPAQQKQISALYLSHW